MSNLPRGPQRAFSEILQSWEQGKLLQKEGQKKVCPAPNFAEFQKTRAGVPLANLT